MAKHGFKVMDSDIHVIEPRDLWQRYMEPAFRDRAPRFEPIDGSRAEAGVSSQRMSTPSKASASVSGSSRSPMTTS